MRVERWLEASASRYPEQVGLVSGRARWSYRQLDEASSRIAAGLDRHGVRRGDRVVIQLPNGIEAVLALFAVLKVGAVFVMLNPTTKVDKLRFVIADSGAAAVVVTAEGAWHLSQAIDGLSSPPVAVAVGANAACTDVGLRTIAWSSLLSTESALTAADHDRGIDIDLAALIYTSGSTGIPKAVMLTHENITCAATSISSYLRHTPNDIILNILPLSFDYGLYQIFLAFRAGARLVLGGSLAYPAAVLETIRREHVTGFPIVPTMAAMLLKHDLAAYDLSTLRYLTSTGAVLPPAHLAELRYRLPWVRLFSMYGLTECKRVSFLAPEETGLRPESVGRPMDNVEVFVEWPDGALHTHGIGQLVVRGSNVMEGYWRRPEETSRVLRPGRSGSDRLLYSGDMFRVDEDGYMYFLGRMDDMIKTRGYRVSPREIEAVICEIPAVIEAAVVGVAHPIFGEAIKACVTIAPGAVLTEDDVVGYCAARLEDYMVPHQVAFLPALPQTASGKIVRSGLRASA